MIRMKFNILIGTLCFLMTSCLIDNDRGHEVSGGQVDVTFAVTLPSPEMVNTRAGLPYGDADIKTVDVLIFDKDGKFMNRVKVDEAALTTTAQGVNFSVRLDATPDKRILHLVANGRTTDGVTDRVNFSSVTAGMLENTTVTALTTLSLDNSGLLTDILPLVMWGRTELNGVSAVTKAEGVKLLRTTACVQVKATSAVLADLTIEKIGLMGAVKQGYLTPVNYASEASTPTEARPVVSASTWELNQAWSVEGFPVLYTYERNYTTPDYQSVIISAVYKGQSCFYKVALATSTGTVFNIVRNHRYNLNILSVDGPGYADVNTAMASAPSNALKVALTDEDEDFPCVVADAQYVMGLSNNSAVMYGTSSGEVELGTVYSSRGIAPVLSVLADCNWLTGLNVISIGSNKYRIIGTLVNEGAYHSTTLTLTCDNLSQIMQVDWISTISSPIALFGGDDENWTAQIVSGAVLLNPYNPAIGEMVTSLTSKYGLNAYLYVNAGASGVVKISTSVHGTAISRRITIL